MKRHLFLLSAVLWLNQSYSQCPTPNPVTASPASICAGGTTSLNATSLGSSINWFTVPVGGVPIGSSGSGMNFPVSPVVTTTYYAEAFTVGTTTFNYTGGVQTYTVPAGVSSLSVDVVAARGGSCWPNVAVGPGANGGRVTGTIPVVGGQVLNIYVGGQGGNGAQFSGGAAGYNGGGQGALYSGNYSGGGGGGASDIRQSPYSLNDRLVVAGGGGGGAYNYGTANYDRGGRGGNLTAEGGFSGNILMGNGPAPGGPGSQVSGGTAGQWPGYCIANVGVFGIGGNGALGCGNSGGGGGGGYYGGGGASWAGGGGGSSYLIGGGGSHTLGYQMGDGYIVIQGSGCISPARTAIVVTVNPNPTITVNSGTICAGQSFTINPSGANTYTYQGGTNVVSPGVTTSYTVTGTSAAGCISVGSATSVVTVSGLPTITVNSGSICLGQSFTMVPSGAVSYTYQGGSPVVSPTVNTSYTVTGSNGVGCTATLVATSNVTVNPLPVVSITGPSAVCVGQPAGLIGGGANTYSWSTGALTQSISPSPVVNTTYSVIGTSAIGCTASAFITVSVIANPTITISGPTQICIGGTANLVANGGMTYSWSTGALTQNIAVSPAFTTTYSVLGTNTIAGCFATAVQTVVVNPLPIVTISGGNTVCAGSTLNLVASGANTYTWNTGANTNGIAVTPTANTSYTAVGSNTVTGCMNAAVQSVTVYPVPSVTVTGPSALCIGQSITLSCFGANTYLWNTGSTSTVIVVSPTVSTSYTVVGSSTTSCGSNATVKNVVVNPLPSVSILPAAPIICKGESLPLNASGANTYSWNTGALTSSIVVSPSVNTTYTVMGTNTLTGCYKTTTVVVTVNLCTGLNGVMSSLNGVIVYPNPHNGEFSVELNNGLNKTIEMTDVTGRIILSETSSNDKIDVNLGNFSNGIYYLRVQSDNQIKVIKVVKQ